MGNDDGKKVAKRITRKSSTAENQNSTKFLFATVTGVSPWAIRTEDGLPITNEFIHVSPFINTPAPRTKTLKHNHKDEVKDDLEPDVPLWEDTKAGDTVAVLNTNDSQIFILLWKVKDGGSII